MTAEYFENNGFSQHEVSRIDPTIVASVAPPPEIDTANGYSVRWSGYFTPPLGGPKLFTSEVTNNAAVEIKVNGMVVSRKSGPVNLVPPQPVTLNAGQPYPLLVTVRSPSPTTHRVVWRQFANPVWREFQESELTAAVDPVAPPFQNVVSSGPGTIATYIRSVPGAVGYHTFYSDQPGAQNFDSPTNGQQPITELSYPGSYYYLYAVGTISNGQERFVRSKAVYTNAVTGMPTLSSPTPEESALADPDTPRWNTRDPLLILPAVAEGYELGFGEPLEPGDPLEVLGPDESVYDYQTLSVRESQGAADEDGTAYVLRDSSVIALMTENEWLNDDPDLPPPPHHTGPFHRTMAKPGYAYARGEFAIPSVTTTVMSPDLLGGKDSADTAYLYLGCSSIRGTAGNETDHEVDVDAGLMYQNGFWRAFISPQNQPLTSKAGKSVKWLSGLSSISAPTNVRIELFVRPPTATEVAKNKISTRNVYLRIEDLGSQEGKNILSSSVKGLSGDPAKFQFKRCHSIAQAFQKRSVYWNQGWWATGSYFFDSRWRLGRLGQNSGATVSWSQSLVDGGRYRIGGAQTGPEKTVIFPAQRVFVSGLLSNVIDVDIDLR
ncbi:MAG: hypothetical protein KIS64_02195 [Fimbriimonadaceae bacterium]|nr:hypothetical protein [Fimbriimonadaceae bacterium]